MAFNHFINLKDSFLNIITCETFQIEFQMNSIVIPSLLYTILVLKCDAETLSQLKLREKSEILSRKTRRISYYPYQSGFGLAAALAVPLDNGRGKS